MSCNQLKSGHLSIRASNHIEMQALRQYLEDWANLIGYGAYVRNSTYGILAHLVRVRTMDMMKFEENRYAIF